MTVQARLRAISGSILFLFLTCHLINHAFGLVSFQAMGHAHDILMTTWRTPVGTAILSLAFLTHYFVAILAIYRRRTMTITGWEAAQMGSGLIIPILIVEHILGTRIAEEVAGVDPTYRYVIAALWVAEPVTGVLQGLAVIVAWTHGCIGLHFWLRVKDWYGAWRRQLLGVALVLPALSLAGYVSSGFEVLFELDRDHMVNAILSQARFDPAKIQPLLAWKAPATATFVLLGTVPFLARFVRDRIVCKPRVALMLPDGTRVPVPLGATALEALRAAGRPHAAVCGGRGRCTTCRVRVIQGAEELEPPADLEESALQRIKALEGVRLACQIRPKAHLGVSPLLPPTATARDGRQMGGLEGEERQVTCLFIDIRRSTKLGEEKLPYDVLFILNQFFSEMSHAIAETGGHYAQFNGDGLMALYGLETSPEIGARSALNGARAMLQRLEKLNKSLESELPFPLAVGIGLHHGEAIVGAMGPPRAQITSAIGDTINIAARLESLTKEHGVPVILSHEVALAAGVATATLTAAEVPVRGRTAPVTFYPVGNPDGLFPV
ncbi:MAG: adenylate/guanylate cyclase domain-containing protein [Alphaproteobacteria bacterium]|nr:adenylate/guanylate cyclase domain-containing protein [Alphaproteobacteria bacterium]